MGFRSESWLGQSWVKLLPDALQVFTIDRISASLGQPLMSISPPTAAMLVRLGDGGRREPLIGHQQGLEMLIGLV